MPTRYAILHHTGVPEPHFDLMFETYAGSALATWRSPRWPLVGPTTARRLKDHRRVYLDFEGEIGGKRGRVCRVSGGTCDVEVGEAAAWTISLLDGAGFQRLVLRPVADDLWELRATDM